MPIKKKKISELEEANNLKGFFTIGYRLVDGVKESVKYGLEKIQNLYENLVKAISDAQEATTDVRQLEATVEANEEQRKATESQRVTSEQERKTSESERIASEFDRIFAEEIREQSETDRSVSELSRQEAENMRDNSETTREEDEATRKAAETVRVASDVARNTAEQGRKDAETLRVLAEEARMSEFTTLKEASETAMEKANDTASHPTYIGADNYVYKWNADTRSYNKMDIFVKGDAFTIKKTYPSIEAMTTDVNNADIIEGSFVLINTEDVENPDNARLYVKVRNEDATYSYSFLVDMSGAIGFTGKTPQFVKGTITTGEAGSDVQLSLSENGVDGDGNPVYALNIVIPRGNPGAAFKVLDHFDTLNELKAVVPDGSAVDGCYAVGSLPYTYYAWYAGEWQTQGRLQGIDGKSAYQIAVDGGFVGTVAEWLVSLKGTIGVDGKPGANGMPCTHSWNGTTLTVTSASGTSSANLKGEKGDKGDTGAQGPKGDTSYNADTLDGYHANSFYTHDGINTGWFRSSGEQGWYSNTYGGGIYCTDSTFVRTYNNKAMAAAGGFWKDSDVRLKTGIQPLRHTLGQLCSIPTDSFLMTGKLQIGTIAQEIEKVCPEVVSESLVLKSEVLKRDDWETIIQPGHDGKDEEYVKVKRVEYEMLGVLALEGVKLLKAEIDELKDELKRLKNG